VWDGTLIRKRYHAPLTPQQRLVADPRIPQSLIEIADTVPIATTGVPPLEAFLESLKVSLALRRRDPADSTAQALEAPFPNRAGSVGSGDRQAEIPVSTLTPA
jgi:hypothetical protein